MPAAGTPVGWKRIPADTAAGMPAGKAADRGRILAGRMPVLDKATDIRGLRARRNSGNRPRPEGVLFRNVHKT